MMNYKLRNWRVSYYQTEQRQWIYGQLTCSPYNVRFHADSTTTSEGHKSEASAGDHHQNQNDSKDGSITETKPDCDVVLLYTDIKQVQRAKSMFVFPAVTVQTQEGTTHWFSSLPDRHSVFNALDYFSRHNLLGTNKGKKPTSDPTTHTRLGQQLLQSAEDSERTLAAAAADLHAQGRQLDRASVRLMEMHEDLDAADRLLSGLNTYLGQWSLPPQYKQVEMVHISKDDVTSDHDLEVLSAELSKEHWRSQQVSFLRVTETGLLLLNARQRVLHTFRWMHLSRVFVVSPWEVVLTNHVAGRADVSVSVVSSALLPVLRLLERKVSHLMDYQTPPPLEPEPPAHNRYLKNEERFLGTTQATHWGSQRLESGRLNSRKEAEDTSEQTQMAKQTQEAVSEGEVTALCSKLGDLKSMARAVGDELTAQNEALEDMIDSVDHADSRVREATRRTKKLM